LTSVTKEYPRPHHKEHHAYDFLINGELGQATDSTYPVYKQGGSSVMAWKCRTLPLKTSTRRWPQHAQGPRPGRPFTLQWKMAMLNRLADLMDQHADAIG
jgi:hypothetical protein